MAEVHPYIYEAMLQLVLVHARVTGIAKSLVPRVLSALVEQMATEALKCFEQVKSFGMGGMLQATLEIEFLHQTVGQHVSPVADEKLQQIYKTISQSYYKKPDRDADELTRELDQLKKMWVLLESSNEYDLAEQISHSLKVCKQATVLQFLCFRRSGPKTSTSNRDAATKKS